MSRGQISEDHRLMPSLRFLEVDFLKPTAKGPKARDKSGDEPAATKATARE